MEVHGLYSNSQIDQVPVQIHSEGQKLSEASGGGGVSSSSIIQSLPTLHKFIWPFDAVPGTQQQPLDCEPQLQVDFRVVHSNQQFGYPGPF